MKNVLGMQIVSVSYWSSIVGCVGIIMLIEVVCNRYSRL